MLKTVNIIATAAYPWKTGTAILALLRAFYLAQRGLDVRLYVPWIPPAEQPLLFGQNTRFDSFKAQEDCMRAFLPGDCPSLQIEFYPAKYIEYFGSFLPIGSLFPMCVVSQRIRFCEWLILEEPEHLTWLHPRNSFGKRASRVTGIVLTNYLYYYKSVLPSYMHFIPKLFDHYNRWLTKRHCDDIILLGRALPHLPKSQYLNVSGIHPSFFEKKFSGESYSKKIYFMGKLLWAKGFQELIDLLSMSDIREIDVYGAGMDQKAIEVYGDSKGIKLHFQGNSSNPAKDIKDYKIFINTSRSDTICTTTAEALGQGKFVIIPAIPGNDEFYIFKNCLVYSSPQEFIHQLKFAMEHNPEEDSGVYSLTWEAVIDRLLQYYEETQFGGRNRK